MLIGRKALPAKALRHEVQCRIGWRMLQKIMSETFVPTRFQERLRAQ